MSQSGLIFGVFKEQQEGICGLVREKERIVGDEIRVSLWPD